MEWLITTLNATNERSFSPLIPDIEIYSDVSLSGWGACSKGVRTRVPWAQEQQAFHINELELKATWYAVQSLAGIPSSIGIKLFLDNNTAVCYINKGGGSKSRNLTKIAKRILDWCKKMNNRVEDEYLPGHLNMIADAESRFEADSSDWKLDSCVFYKISALWNVKIDLYASY